MTMLHMPVRFTENAIVVPGNPDRTNRNAELAKVILIKSKEIFLILLSQNMNLNLACVVDQTYDRLLECQHELFSKFEHDDQVAANVLLMNAEKNYPPNLNSFTDMLQLVVPDGVTH